ncbi:DNA/RNA non-specific endonuclease [Raineya orbicola]|jgi:endonuclease G|uniref:Endonuclease n=1 Tax=Raineya orbicola TaxID=2016530 RepID=A0A2N3IF75_9BACT|nr:DNA/RNA non-specific endonuclease [Raineya orbicola]
MRFNKKTFQQLKVYFWRILIFGGVGLLLFYIFAPNATLKNIFARLEKTFPNQTFTTKLYEWKVEYFSKKNASEKEQEQKKIEQEFEIVEGKKEQESSASQTSKPPKKQGNYEDLEIPKSPYNDEIIRHTYFTLAYVEEHEQARWVAYKMTAKNLEKNVTRSQEIFYPDRKVSTGSALPMDYAGSGFDRGHLAPAGDFTGNEQMMHETFAMSNMSPQYPLCNRETWRLLEEKVRFWGEKKGDLYIITGPVFKGNMQKIGKKNKISVPPAYYKVIVSLKEERGIAFIVPNVNKKENYRNYQVSIDEVEKETGLDFFYLLPDDLEEKIESSVSKEGWFNPPKSKNDKNKKSIK